MKWLPLQRTLDAIGDSIHGRRYVDVRKQCTGADKEVRFLDLRLHAGMCCFASVRVYAGGHRRIASKVIDLVSGSNRVAILVRGKLGGQESVHCLVASYGKVRIGSVTRTFVESGPDLSSVIPSLPESHKPAGIGLLWSSSPSETIEKILGGVASRGGFVWWPELPGIPHTCFDEFTLSGFTPKEMEAAMVESAAKMEEQAVIETGTIRAEAKAL